ncbi:MAG TPA: CheB methylesterase domain-containing protein, partial [Pseudolabrys sp.]|nr:CheB methylesterase domain-containing protein [Pseudolabrys sp.]
RAPRPRAGADKLVMVGASTGGVEALKALLMGLPADCPPTLITQHMPPRFTAAFAERLNRECPMTVCEATHDQPVEPGHVYIAPGAQHLQLGRRGPRHVCLLSDAAPVSGHRPSVDVLFHSAAQVAGPAAVGVILTGMGKDGADGMLAMRKAGAVTLGQDEDSALIYGMPRVAFERGAVTRQVSLSHMADAILDACESGTAGALRANHSIDAA